MYSRLGFTREKIINLLNIKRTLSLVWQSAPGWTLINASLVVLQGALPLASLYLIKLIVDSVSVGINSANKEASLEQILFYIFLAAGVEFLTVLCSLASYVVSGALGATVSDYILDLLHAKSIEVDLEYYENSKYYDTLHRAQNDAPYRPTQIINGLGQIGESSISLVAVFALIASFNWIIAAALMLTAIPSAFVRLIYSNKIYRWQLECTPRERKAWYFNWVLSNDYNAKEVRLFDIGPLFMKKYHDLRKELRNERISITARQAAVDLAAHILGVVVIFGSFVFIALSAFQGNITLGDLVMYFEALRQSQSFLSTLLTGLAEIYEDNLFMSTLYEFLDLKPAMKESPNPVPIPKAMKEGIAFEQVGYCYPGEINRALDDINLHINPGQIIALVGNNGSGKTTLIKLLCRLYDPMDGRITLDGIDIRDFTISDLRREISVVFQDYVHYNLTARENIWLGDVNMPLDTKKILQAAECSGANLAIERLDNGYETILGRWFEDGTELSIGEWQKVALARAFFRNSQVIVLDEPTSSLDLKAEEDVFEKFLQLATSKTVIIISHRLSTVKMADCIYFMKDGKILENGKHEELMMLDGEYAKLFKIQAQHYN